MAERWLLLLNALTQRLLEDPGLFEDPRDLIDELAAEGYQAQEVEAAVAWLGRFVSEPVHGSLWSAEPFTSRGLRTRSLEEQISFSPEAFGYLMRLENFGLIDPTQREEILERALGTFDEEIGEEEIKAVSRIVLQDSGYGAADADADPLDVLDNPQSRQTN